MNVGGKPRHSAGVQGGTRYEKARKKSFVAVDKRRNTVCTESIDVVFIACNKGCPDEMEKSVGQTSLGHKPAGSCSALARRVSAKAVPMQLVLCKECSQH